MKGADVELALHEQPGSAELAPYKRLLGDGLNGDASLFAREDGVEAAWAVVEPVLGDAVPLHRAASAADADAHRHEDLVLFRQRQAPPLLGVAEFTLRSDIAIGLRTRMTRRLA